LHTKNATTKLLGVDVLELTGDAKPGSPAFLDAGAFVVLH